MIQVKDLTKNFGEKEILRHMSFTIRRGEVLGLLGHNGAGKTTTLRLLATILTPSGGEIVVCDQQLSMERDKNSFKRRLGYVPDEPFLFPYLTGREMLYFIGSLHRLESETIKVKTENLAETFEIHSSLDQLVKTYSRGMKRKLSLIASLLNDPLYWFLDEPTESLDPIAVHVLKDLIVSFKRTNRAVLLSTHQLALAEELCDRVVILYEGRMVFEGTITSLRKQTRSEVSSLEEIYFDLFGNRSRSSFDQHSFNLGRIS